MSRLPRSGQGVLGVGSGLAGTARGFTLLEVLVALAVVAIALGALTKGAASNAANAAYLRERTLAHWVAMNRVAEVQLAKDWPAAGRRTGSATMAGREWWWRERVLTTPDGDVRRLEVEVRGERDAHEPLALATAFLGRPR